MKRRILFVCTHNRCRSQLAEALVNHDLADRFEAFSAGTEPTEPHPLALRVLAELGIAHPNARSKHLDHFIGQSFDHVITLCDHTNEACPFIPGGFHRTHLAFDDPDTAEGNEEQRLAVFRRVRDEIREQVEAFLIRAQSNDFRIGNEEMGR